jgi:hypothetical protein
LTLFMLLLVKAEHRHVCLEWYVGHFGEWLDLRLRLVVRVTKFLPALRQPGPAFQQSGKDSVGLLPIAHVASGLRFFIPANSRTASLPNF